MQGATFTISSLGGIGGTGFTPNVNAPEVAILGVCIARARSNRCGMARNSPRLMCPLSLSFDHPRDRRRAGTRFTVYLGEATELIIRVIL